MKLVLTEPKWVQILLSLIVVAFISLFLILPLIYIFAAALSSGIHIYLNSITSPETLSSIYLTLTVVATVVPLNTFFGVLLAWTVTKYHFKGKSLMITLADLPFSISPVIGGLIFVLLFGDHGTLGKWLMAHNIQLVFNTAGIVIASLFVTYPFVARELIPVMESRGTQEEEASLILGASTLRTFFKVTVPNIKWGLLYGIILCSARTIGDFGAVSVISGHIVGQTNTMPLQVEAFYNGYQMEAAFALSSLMSVVALASLALKGYFDWKSSRTRSIDIK
ncbi:sulfate ABC transporter permease subunit CysW [Sporolactobacillus sp. CPB3-1]|uniref:Sulfate ABC transporter permease subunit CysW n=1 Tax=Sporolactobacillus mangiferae TaxID=2940498 RepID=A0ABT0M9E0_9BACL|nr:sulfate ABC transporter permease subunit CysW [Sporolactobacillus mangiferae]MCL1631253.1 sulfate ABC transporter permease subunit CysW [Sporolactobacillus mangiferae]